MSKFKYNAPSEEAEFLKDLALVLEQLNHHGVKTVNHTVPKGTVSMEDLEGKSFQLVGDTITDFKRGELGKLAAAMVTAQKNGVNPVIVDKSDTYRTTVVTGAIDQPKIYAEVDKFYAHGVFHTDAPDKSHLSIARQAAKAAEVHVATILTCKHNGMVVVKGISQFTGELPVEFLPYIQLTAEMMNATGGKVSEEIASDLIAAAVVAVEELNEEKKERLTIS